MKSADTAKIDAQVKKISATASKKIITQGKRHVHEESEEIKLDARVLQPSNAPKAKVDVKAQVECQRSKKNATAGKTPASKTVKTPVKSNTVTINQAHEVPTPNEVAIVGNPYDLKMEGVRVTETELKQHASLNKANPTILKMHQPARTASARHSKTQSDIDLENFLSTQQKCKIVFFITFLKKKN